MPLIPESALRPIISTPVTATITASVSSGEELEQIIVYLERISQRIILLGKLQPAGHEWIADGMALTPRH